VAPMLAELPAREVIIAYPGASALEHFSFRASLREMIRTAVVHTDVLTRLLSLPLWHVRALDRLLQISTTNTLPLVEPTRTVVLLAPPSVDGAFVQRLSRMPRAVARRVLEQSPAQLWQIQRIHTLESLVRELVRDTGVQLISPVTRAEL